VYGCTVALKVVFSTEWTLAASVWAHILLDSLWVVGLHMCLEVECAREGTVAVRALVRSAVS